MSRRKSPVTPTKVKLAVQLAIRHRKLSAAISDMRKTNASHTLPAWAGPGRQAVDQILHAILRAYRAGNRCNHGGEDDDMRCNDAGAGSAARRETDDWRILKDCPCCCKPVGEERKTLPGRLPFDRMLDTVCRGSRCAAITAQQFEQHGKSLIGGDGISKTMVWKKCAPSWELRTCGNVPFAACRCHGRTGGFSPMSTNRRR